MVENLPVLIAGLAMILNLYLYKIIQKFADTAIKNKLIKTNNEECFHISFNFDTSIVLKFILPQIMGIGLGMLIGILVNHTVDYKFISYSNLPISLSVILCVFWFCSISLFAKFAITKNGIEASHTSFIPFSDIKEICKDKNVIYIRRKNKTTIRWSRFFIKDFDCVGMALIEAYNNYKENN